jgi:SNF2 family DNA or RNA helicase
MNLKTILYDFQQKAVDKLIGLRVSGLFMEMGTGKTRVAIELVSLRCERISNVVWFCPVSLKATIRYEIQKHTDTPGDGIVVFDDKTTMRTIPRDAFWYIVGIESMSSSDRMVLTANDIVKPDSFVIVDESSYIKGHNARRTKRITYMAARAHYRAILTGTPLSQGVVDLYAQMRFLSPKILGYNSFYSFAHNHLEYSEKYPGLIVRAHNTGWLAAKVEPYIYQVTKAECLDLPPKLYDTRYYSMIATQRHYYERAKWELFLSIPDEDLDSYALFRLFSALQQITCGFWNRRENNDFSAYQVRGPEFKFFEFEHKRTGILLEIVADIPVDEKVIIWSKYRYSIEQIVGALTEEYGPDSLAQFHGDLGEQERNVEIERFRDDARFLVATQSAGGHGLTLNEANYVVFYSNSFKYSERLQAEDRCHRIGQDRPVTYIDIVCQNSVDTRIEKALADKGDVVQAFKRKMDAIKDGDKDSIKKLIGSL